MTAHAQRDPDYYAAYDTASVCHPAQVGHQRVKPGRPVVLYGQGHHCRVVVVRGLLDRDQRSPELHVQQFAEHSGLHVPRTLQR